MIAKDEEKNNNNFPEVPEKPQCLIPKFENIPSEIKNLRRWCLWRLECRENKKGEFRWTKVPYQACPPPPDEVRWPNAKSDDSSTWYEFDHAMKTYIEEIGWDGVGFMLGEGWSGVDADKCINRQTGEVEAWAADVVKDLNSYAEISPSGSGVKILVRGQKPEGRCRKDRLEMYSKGRFFTITGNRVAGTPATLESREKELLQLHTRVFPPEDPPKEKAPASSSSCNGKQAHAFTPEDERILATARSAANGAKFISLYDNGETGAESHSEADMALCYLLCFWSGRNAGTIDRLFRASALFRGKWDEHRGEKTYGQITVEKALALPGECFKWQPDVDWSGMNRLYPEVNTPSQDEGCSYDFHPIDSATFMNSEYKVEWLVSKMLVKDQPGIIGGPKKALKTSILIDLALSLGTGKPFLGKFNVYKPCRTAFISGESGEFTIQETANRVCAAKGMILSDADCLWDFRLPQLSVDEEVGNLSKGLRKHKVGVAIIDPLYLCLLSGQSDKKNAANLFDMGPLLMKVGRACLNAGCTPLLVHHARKNNLTPFDPLDLEDLAFAGVQEYARQWLLVNRQQAYQPGTGHHRLWMQAGGSCGQGGLWGLDIKESILNEDFTGRTWDVTILSVNDIKEQKQNQKDQLEKDFHIRLLGLIDTVPKPCSKTHLKNLTGWGSSKFDRVYTRLLDEKKIKEIQSEVEIGCGGKKKSTCVEGA